MPDHYKKWVFIALLSVIWGSSFILIKKSLLGFEPLHLGGLRILFAASFLLIFGFRSLGKIGRKNWKWVIVAGFLSSFFPPFFFALAQTEIDSGVTSIFNSLAPLSTALVGALFFGVVVMRKQFLGVAVGLFGTGVLIYTGAEFNPDQNYWYAIFIILSAVGYAFNINIIKKHLSHLSPLAVTTGSFAVVLPPTIGVLYATGIQTVSWTADELQLPILCILLLAFFGTALANILFNKLIAISSPVFAASVTYTAPLVAILWGLWDGEHITVYQLLGGAIVLCGVYMVNKKKKAAVK
ncbi:DMT family transporter [Spongiimicrobium salis]|uniref:DMT family transporter n=1 Tax=Spongiimicrobium salis TaxID=1667022 RepID=UPI00374DB8DB